MTKQSTGSEVKQTWNQILIQLLICCEMLRVFLTSLRICFVICN